MKGERNMTTTEKIMRKRGQFGSAEWERKCRTLRACPYDTIIKRTEAKNIRFGCSYDNLQSTREGRADGTLPKENAGLNGLEWEVYPYILFNPRTGKRYARISTVSNTVYTVKYFADGVEVQRQNIEDYLQASEKKTGEVPAVFNIGLDNIIEIK